MEHAVIGKYSKEPVVLSVRDDGCGFEQTAVLANTGGYHLGLRSLGSRPGVGRTLNRR
jgi:signal transduction histidine kinase